MSKFKVEITRIETYRRTVEVEAETAEAAKALAEANEQENEYADMFDCPDEVSTEFSVPPENWYDWKSLTVSDHNAVQRDSMRRGWGYSLADLKKEIAKFKKAMEKGDRHATSMICARLEDCNYHDVCGRLSEGDLDGAMEKAVAIYDA